MFNFNKRSALRQTPAHVVDWMKAYEQGRAEEREAAKRGVSLFTDRVEFSDSGSSSDTDSDDEGLTHDYSHLQCARVVPARYLGRVAPRKIAPLPKVSRKEANGKRASTCSTGSTPDLVSGDTTTSTSGVATQRTSLSSSVELLSNAGSAESDGLTDPHTAYLRGIVEELMALEVAKLAPAPAPTRAPLPTSVRAFLPTDKGTIEPIHTLHPNGTTAGKSAAAPAMVTEPEVARAKYLAGCKPLGSLQSRGMDLGKGATAVNMIAVCSVYWATAEFPKVLDVAFPELPSFSHTNLPKVSTIRQTQQ